MLPADEEEEENHGEEQNHGEEEAHGEEENHGKEEAHGEEEAQVYEDARGLVPEERPLVFTLLENESGISCQASGLVQSR